MARNHPPPLVSQLALATESAALAMYLVQTSWQVHTRPLILLMALFCAAALAEEAREQLLPADYMDRMRAQIYEDASDWRIEEQQIDSGWRKTPLIEEKTRRFGYDPESEERLHSKHIGDYDNQHRFGEPEPNTIFRVDLE